MLKRIKDNLFIILFFCSAIAVIIIAVFASTTMRSSADLLAASSKAQLVALSKAAAMMVTAEDLIDFTEPEDMETEAYLALKANLITFTEESNLAYTYYIRYLPDVDMQRFIIDNTPVDYTALSLPPMPREEATDIALAGKANAMEIGSYSEGWEGYMTAFAPVYYEDGSPSDFIAGVDKIDVSIKKEYDSFRFMSVILISSVLVVLAVGITSVFLYQKKARLSRVASESKGTFLANMSHEMRTPMNAIIGMTEIARKSTDPGQVTYCLNKINSAALHLLGIINDVLDLSKIEAGKMTLNEAPFSPALMLESVLQVMQFKADEKQQTLHLDVSEDFPSYILSDEKHLSQVVTNLLSNAIKFTPDGGEVFVTAGKTIETPYDIALVFSVRDTGIGISAEQQAKLFHSFEQADDSISRKFGGTGLGLAISKRIVEMMHGDISIASTPGEGSTFTFTIHAQHAPKAAVPAGNGEEAPAQACEPVAANAGRYAGKHILLVEDIEINREIVIALLEDTGAVIDVAENGLVASQRFEAEPGKYDIILMDIHMPEMDGYTATRTIRAMPVPRAKDIPIIAMTANVFKEDVERCLESGMNGHLGKPLVIDDLMRKLDDYLGQ